MRTALLVVIAFLCVSCTPCVAQILRIKNHNYADVVVGDSPGRTVTLLVRWDQDNSYLFSSPNLYSKTWADDSAASTTPSGSDIVYIGNTPVRLRFVIGEPADAVFYPSTGVSYDGILGLSLGSAVWSVWTSVMVSPSEIRFGSPALAHEFRRYTLNTPHFIPSLTLSQQVEYMQSQQAYDVDSSQRSGLYKPFSFALDAALHSSASSVLEKRCAQLGHDPLDCHYAFSNASYRVIVSPSSDYSILPPHFAAITSSHIVEMSGDSMTLRTFNSHNKQIWLTRNASREHKSLLVYDPSDDRYTLQSSQSGTTHYNGVVHGHDQSLIVLGALAMRRFVWAYDLVRGEAAFAAECSISSVCVETIEVIEKTENTVFTIVGLCTVALWIVAVIPRFVFVVPPKTAAVVAAATTPAATRLRYRWVIADDDRVKLEYAAGFILAVSFAVCVLELDVVHEIGVFLHTREVFSWLVLCGFILTVCLLVLMSKIADARHHTHICWMSVLLYSFLVLWIVQFPLAAKSPVSRILFVFFTLLVLFNAARTALTVVFMRMNYEANYTPLLCIGVAVFAFFSTVVMGKILEEIYGPHENSILLGFQMSYALMTPLALYRVVQHKLYPDKLISKARKQKKKTE